MKQLGFYSIKRVKNIDAVWHVYHKKDRKLMRNMLKPLPMPITHKLDLPNAIAKYSKRAMRIKIKRMKPIREITYVDPYGEIDMSALDNYVIK